MKTSRDLPIPTWLSIVTVAIAMMSVSGRSQDEQSPKIEEAPAEEESQDLFTKSFHVLPSFYTRKNNEPKESVKEWLKKRGVQFPEGASATMSNRTSQIIIRNTKDELKKAEQLINELNEELRPKSLTLLVESIEVEDALYHDWMFENRLTGSIAPLRKQVQEWVKSGKGTIIETTVVNCRSAKRGKSESIHEYIYPTEGDPPEIATKLILEGADAEAPITGGTPTAFETRNVGNTIEFDPVIGSDGVTVDLNITEEIVKQNGFTDWPPDNFKPLFTISMPRFHTAKITTQITLQHGEYGFLGTTRPLKPAVESRKRPLVLTFVRADVLKP